MQSTISLALALFSTYTFAQSAASSEAASQLETLGASIFAEPAVSSKLVEFESTIPPPLATAVKSALPAIESDIVAYLASLANTPTFTSVGEALEAALPSDVAAQLSTAPKDFFVARVTETADPTWVSAIPSDVADYLSSVNLHIQSIEIADVSEVLPSPTGGPYGYGYPAGTEGFATGVHPTGTVSGYGTSPTQATTSPIPFVNAASRSSGTLSIAMLTVGVAAWLMT
ncbi:hypothetical protein MMC29_001140 [Sticta canariensis]|nr:hypothetical protein [Sticta canariensis]